MSFRSAIDSTIDSAISDATGEPFVTLQTQPVGGGSISSASLVYSKDKSFFVKKNAVDCADMFAAEVDGLNALRKPNVIKVPEPICSGVTGKGADANAFLVLEHLSLSNGDSFSSESLGRKLAALHQETSSHFGWFRNNTIGATLQVNTQTDSWVDFYRENRLQFQLSLAAENGYGAGLQKLGDRLCDKLDLFFQTYQPQPALLHGDLWSGNYGYVCEASKSGKENQNCQPVIFDPATYYGDREADIAMTELFGGFPVSFYKSYNEAFALDEGYAVRKTLYNLYHILNHLNLFGSGYRAQAMTMMKQLLAEV